MVVLNFFKYKLYFHKYVIKTLIDSTLFACVVIAASLLLKVHPWIVTLVTLISFASNFFTGYRCVPYLFHRIVLTDHDIRVGQAVFQWDQIASVHEENKYAVYHFNLFLIVEYPLGRYYVIELKDDRDISHTLLLPFNREIQTLIEAKVESNKIDTNPLPDYLHPQKENKKPDIWVYALICFACALLCIIDCSAWKVFVFCGLFAIWGYRLTSEYYRYRQKY